MDCIIINANGDVEINPSILNTKIDGYISKGSYGYVFSGYNNTNKYVIKIMPSSKHNIEEINIMRHIMTMNIRNNIFPNYVYLISYHLKCNMIKDTTNLLLNAIKKI